MSIDPRHAVALALPIAVPLAMTATFTVARDGLGDHLGYVAGFGARPARAPLSWLMARGNLPA